MLSVEGLSEWQVKEAEKVIHNLERLDNHLITIMNKRLKTGNEHHDKELLKLKRCYLFCRLSDIFEGRVTELDENNNEEEWGELIGHKVTD